MPPRNVVDVNCVTTEDDDLQRAIPPIHEAKRPPMEIVWKNVVRMLVLHTVALLGLFSLPWARWMTWIWGE